MAVCQAIREKEKTGSWSKVFPNEQVTETQSALFVKKLLALSVSNILYLRAIFPEEAFGDRSLESIPLKVLKDDSSISGAKQVISWVKGCFDALDKKYLRMLILGIYTDVDHPDKVIESYTFKFSYTKNGGIDIYRNEEKINSTNMASKTKAATIKLLRTIVVLTSSLFALPQHVRMTMKLLYFDNVTPADYEPPGFKACDNDSFEFEEEPTSIKLGDVNTPFHMVKLRIKTDAKQFANDAGETCIDPIIPQGLDHDDEQSVMETEEQPEETVGQQIEPQVVPELADSVPDMSPARPASDGMAMIPTPSQGSETVVIVRCACCYDKDDGLMILCAGCNCWQHAICYKIHQEDEVPQRHICELCAKEDDVDYRATDPYLSSISEISKEATCLWRRVIMVCVDWPEENKLVGPSLARRLGVENAIAQGLLSRLQKEGYVKTAKNKKLGKQIDRQKLNEGIKKYFGNEEAPPLKIENRPTVDEEIDAITSQTKVIDLSTNKEEQKKKNVPAAGKKKLLPMTTLKGKNNLITETRGKKRGTVYHGEDEYEIANSQDSYATTRKRRKSSMPSQNNIAT